MAYDNGLPIALDIKKKKNRENELMMNPQCPWVLLKV